MGNFRGNSTECSSRVRQAAIKHIHNSVHAHSTGIGFSVRWLWDDTSSFSLQATDVHLAVVLVVVQHTGGDDTFAFSLETADIHLAVVLVVIEHKGGDDTSSFSLQATDVHLAVVLVVVQHTGGDDTFAFSLETADIHLAVVLVVVEHKGGDGFGHLMVFRGAGPSKDTASCSN
ncbi:hypothetical protein DYB25_008471 [Aphanomyces astaci]|uniref:Uncharacterized protein n=1 Tax=Aphanomyces astaci TaxID=112090 RepID=A0A397BF73_APHAT|nr:hypothetical protein DYB25_008471 [Aphanomyces astaci]